MCASPISDPRGKCRKYRRRGLGTEPASRSPRPSHQRRRRPLSMNRAPWLLGIMLIGIAAVSAVPAEAISFNQVFVTPNQGAGTIGFAFAGNKFVGTGQRSGTGAMYQTDLNGGNVQAFASGISLASNPADEHFIASSLGLGGFPSR